MYFEIQIFRNTIINWSIPTFIILIIGILSYYLDFKNYKETYFHYGTIKLYALVNYFIGYGFIACSFFMFMNYYFADQKVNTQSFEIIERTWIQGGGTTFRNREKQPVFTINYKGKKKELIFFSKYYEKMNFYKTIEVDSRKGLFGFEILENKKLN